MGWRMYRLWEADWNRNKERESWWKLLRMETSKTIERRRRRGTATGVFLEVAREEVTVEPLLPTYQLAALPAEIASQELHVHLPGKLAEWVHELVKLKSLVYFNGMAYKITDAAAYPESVLKKTVFVDRMRLSTWEGK